MRSSELLVYEKMWTKTFGTLAQPFAGYLSRSVRETGLQPYAEDRFGEVHSGHGLAARLFGPVTDEGIR
jgi:hypothetical protein